MRGMAVLPIRIFGDPVLREKGRPVTDFGADLGRLVDDMFETMYAARGAGLAAPQVGILKRMFVYDIGDGPQVVCNPALSGYAGSWTYEEGCLSLPGVYVEIDRPMQVTCRFQDLSGEIFEVTADELLGRVFQHESDHCDGLWFIDRADRDKKRAALREFRRRFSDGSTQWIPDPEAPRVGHEEVTL
jgi:peptide deformylase